MRYFVMILSLAFATYMTWLRFQHPELTETQLFLYWLGL